MSNSLFVVRVHHLHSVHAQAHSRLAPALSHLHHRVLRSPAQAQVLAAVPSPAQALRSQAPVLHSRRVAQAPARRRPAQVLLHRKVHLY